jgi:signal transduction histidine kinase
VIGTVSPALHAGSAVLCALSGAVVLIAGRGPVSWALALACLAAAAWAAAIAAAPEAALVGLAGALEIARNAAWLLALLVLYRWLAGPAARTPRDWVVVSAAIVLLAALGALLPVAGRLELPGFGSPVVLTRLALDLLIVVLAENLFRNADADARWHVNLPCIALGGLAAFDLLLFAEAALSRAYSTALLDARAVLVGLATPLLAIAAVRDRRARRGSLVPRRAMFHGATLIIAGAFLLGVGAAGEALRRFGGGWGTTAQASLLAGALMAALVIAASGSARSRLRNLIVDQFFTARYDYRREWLRCIATLSITDETAADPQARAIRAIADPADSPGGVLLLRDAAAGEAQAPAGAATGAATAGAATAGAATAGAGIAGAAIAVPMVWAGSWNVPKASQAMPPVDARLLGADGRITVFGRPGAPASPDAAFGPLWIAVPLLHPREGVSGLVLLAPPRAAFTLDREADELLRTLGRAVAMFLAERRAAERLAEQRRIQDYAKRFAFVAHDVKTVSSQLEMLLANAEENIRDPDFQDDMLLTVRAAATRIRALIGRLGQPGDEPGDEPGPGRAEPVTAVLDRLRAIVASQAHPVQLDRAGGAEEPEAGEAMLAAMAPDRFDTAVGHLINNAAEASRPGEAVRLRARAEAGRVIVDIVDRGPGMSPEFIRDHLFRPLSTMKPEGSGIGAWQARELVREAGGELTVLSRPGVGTTMRLILPAAAGPGAARAATRQEGR